jgi:hypothetical protein
MDEAWKAAVPDARRTRGLDEAPTSEAGKTALLIEALVI